MIWISCSCPLTATPPATSRRWSYFWLKMLSPPMGPLTLTATCSLLMISSMTACAMQHFQHRYKLCIHWQDTVTVTASNLRHRLQLCVVATASTSGEGHTELLAAFTGCNDRSTSICCHLCVVLHIASAQQALTDTYCLLLIVSTITGSEYSHTDLWHCHRQRRAKRAVQIVLATHYVKLRVTSYCLLSTHKAITSHHDSSWSWDTLALSKQRSKILTRCARKEGTAYCAMMQKEVDPPPLAQPLVQLKVGSCRQVTILGQVENVHLDSLHICGAMIYNISIL